MGDRGDDSNTVRTMLSEQGIPPKRNRKWPIDYCKRLDNMGHTVENLLARLKNWRPIATGYNCCARVFRAAVPLGAAVIFWSWVLTPRVSIWISSPLTSPDHGLKLLSRQK